MQLPKDLAGLNPCVKNICIRDLESQPLLMFFFFFLSERCVDLNQKDQYFKYGYLAPKL